MTLGSANRMTWEYIASLRLLVEMAQVAESRESERRVTMLAVIQAVTVGEVFLNLWFRVHVDGNPEHRQSLLKDLKSRKGLEYKIKVWPLRYLQGPLNLTSGAGGEFSRLKTLRNSLVHFTSTYETVRLGGESLGGMADITDYEALTADEAVWAYHTVEGFVAEVFRRAGIAEGNLPAALHAWTGVPQGA